MKNLREKAEKKIWKQKRKRKERSLAFGVGEREEEEEVGPKPELSLKKSEQKAEHTKQASKAKE